MNQRRSIQLCSDKWINRKPLNSLAICGFEIRSSPGVKDDRCALPPYVAAVRVFMFIFLLSSLSTLWLSLRTEALCKMDPTVSIQFQSELQHQKHTILHLIELGTSVTALDTESDDVYISFSLCIISFVLLVCLFQAGSAANGSLWSGCHLLPSQEQAIQTKKQQHEILKSCVYWAIIKEHLVFRSTTST